jgi:hypothetical protein
VAAASIRTEPVRVALGTGGNSREDLQMNPNCDTDHPRPVWIESRSGGDSGKGAGGVRLRGGAAHPVLPLRNMATASTADQASTMKRSSRWKPLSLSALIVAVATPLAVPASAVPERRIVLHGSNQASHPRLSVVGSNLVLVKRQGMSFDASSGCSLVNRGRGIECPLGEGVGAIEVIMGPDEDKVQVMDPLPVRLIARLGGGSDQLLGNSEPDTCYPEGAKRNRCYGFGGNDICITGNKNSDCVGGRGNDFCKHGRGSDGCWGGPGNDVCYMGAGQDGCHGGPGNDRLYGGPDADQLYGGPGHDYCDGGRGVGRSHGCEAGPGH